MDLDERSCAICGRLLIDEDGKRLEPCARLEGLEERGSMEAVEVEYLLCAKCYHKVKSEMKRLRKGK